jgi:dTDP-4-amino-4,6-dideoxygalactose transaminase
VKDGKRNALKSYLEEKTIPSMIYYPVAVHEQKAFKQSIRRIPDLKNTNLISGEVLSLPMHTELTHDQINYITEAVKSFFQ